MLLRRHRPGKVGVIRADVFRVAIQTGEESGWRRVDFEQRRVGALSILGKDHSKQLHEDNGGEERRARHHQEKIGPNASGQASEDRGPTKHDPKPDRLGCQQQREEKGVLARQFNGHECNCSGADFEQQMDFADR